jgi:hypothetical protein
MSDKYILIDKEPVVAANLEAWADWFSTNDRRVALTQVGPYRVSTVFLGLDHRFFGDGPPLLFETMSFGPDDNEVSQLRWSTWAEAELGHMEEVERLERTET